MSNADLSTPVHGPLRLWMGVEVFFGLAAISTIFLRPQDTASNFAWPIKRLFGFERGVGHPWRETGALRT